jgi:uncharacterized membrane protein YhaH (DUF805 family)
MGPGACLGGVSRRVHQAPGPIEAGWGGRIPPVGDLRRAGGRSRRGPLASRRLARDSRPDGTGGGASPEEGIIGMDWALLPLKRYADFTGRSRRREYWHFALGVFAIYLVIALFGGILGSLTPSNGLNSLLAAPAFLLLLLFGLAILLPAIAVQVRRFHDQDRSGWFVLLNLIPYVGGLVVLAFMCLEGTRGPNRFGPDPKAENLGDVFA